MEDSKTFTDRYKQNLKNVVYGEGQEQIVSEKVNSEDQAVAQVFNKFFINIIPNLKISTNHNYGTDFIVTND